MTDHALKPQEAVQTSKVATIAAAHAVHDTYSSFLPPLLPIFIEKLSLAKAEAGLLTLGMRGSAPDRTSHARLTVGGREWRAMRGFFLPLTGVVISRAAMMAAFTTFLPVFLHDFVARAMAVVATGGLADAIGMRRAFLVCAALGVLGSPFVFLLPSRRPGAETG